MKPGFGNRPIPRTRAGRSGCLVNLAGYLFGGRPWLVTAVCLIWGFALIADSAQFSAAVIELSDRTPVGTMLTVQTCVGYLITSGSIHAVQALASAFGWHVAFAALAAGPAALAFRISVSVGGGSGRFAARDLGVPSINVGMKPTGPAFADKMALFSPEGLTYLVPTFEQIEA